MNEGIARKELIKRISNHIGMEVTETDHLDYVEVRSPNGTVLFQLQLTSRNRDKDLWLFGGTSSVLPDDWTNLCRIAD